MAMPEFATGEDSEQESVPWPTESDTVVHPDGREWSIERIGEKDGRASAIADLAPENDERRRSMSVVELKALLRHAGYELE
ncbi:hypothetical protein [Halorhabdus rudnickae]|uniref:hypothetical protein n=1 Tax=Halorhabdus rudnickae TaxID=1775544 RepID=UPI0010823C54|nr:hypothetical protein [Halorhabdus rudnickae]